MASPADDLAELEAFVRERIRLAMSDRAAFERDGARLNSQLMQGEINMGTAMLRWIELRRAGADAAMAEDDTDTSPEES